MLLAGGRGMAQQPAERASAEQICQQASQALAGGRIDAAVRALKTAAQRFPQNHEVQLNLGLALSRQGRLQDAIAPLERATSDPRFASQAHFLLAVDYFESKRYEDAVRELNGLEKSERVLYMLEESERRTGHIDGAKTAFHELLTRYPDSGWTNYLMGTAYEDQQQLEKAIEEYKQAVSKDAAIPNVNFAIGYLYWRQQENEDARIWLKKEASKGCHGLANYYLGEMARSARDTAEAEAFYRRAIQCDATSSEAHLRLGTILEEEKRYPEAVVQLKEAIRLDPEGSSAHYHLGAAYRVMGRKAESDAELAKVREIQARR